MSDDTRKLIPICAGGLIVLIGIVAWRLEPTALAILLGVFFGGLFALGAVVLVLLQRPQQQPQQTVREIHYLPEPEPPPPPYHPPVIVLAGDPRARLRVEPQHATALQSRV